MSVEMVLATSKGGRGFLGSEHAVWKLLMPYRGEYVPRVGEHVKLFHELELELEVTDVTWHSQGAEGFAPSVLLQDLILSPTETGEADLVVALRARRMSGNPRPLPATWPEPDDEGGQVVTELLAEYGWRCN